MKKTLLCLSSLFLTLFSQAQEFVAFQVNSGFNADVIANGTGLSAASTTIAVDNANFAFITADFQATAAGTPLATALPVNGLINSSANTGLQFQMASYSANNVLRIPTQNESGTLVFANPLRGSRLFLLLTSGSGTATISGTINFSDNTTQALSSATVPDWFNASTLPVAISGIGRVNLTNDVVENPSGNPRLYQMEVAILPANQYKQISGITITKTSSEEGVLNLFGVSAEILPTCPSPTGLSAITTASGATVSWTPATSVPSNGYDYYYSLTATAPNNNTEPTGNVASGQTSVTLNDLTIGQVYYFWVRSNCGTTDKGLWRPTTFTTGQLSTTHTAGDILTDKTTSSTITVSSNTACPGVMTVNVPVGYQIASVATSYSMQTASDGFMSEQRSILVCNTTGLKEAAITSGAGDTQGTYQYNRSNLTIANGATGAVEFELRAWRTYGTTGCNGIYNRVANNTWKVTITYQAVVLGTDEKDVAKFKAYPNPVDDVLTVSGEIAISEIIVYNYLGQKVMQQTGGSKLIQLNTSPLSAGSYLVKTKDVDGNQSTSKIIKK